jgi:ubiquinone/menaquinone biosynthesis C-methylase UbiE
VISVRLGRGTLARAMKMGSFEKRFVNRAGHSQHVAEHAEQLVRLADPRPGQRLLDVGCGNGAAPVHLARTFGLETTGVDVDPEQIEAAKEHADGSEQASFLVGDTTSLPFENGTFDIVFTNKVTHHVRDWPTALTEMTRVLKPGGHLVYSDFVAPFGKRLPTRRALDRFAAEQRLNVVRRSGSPFHYTGVFSKPS